MIESMMTLIIIIVTITWYLTTHVQMIEQIKQQEGHLQSLRIEKEQSDEKLYTYLQTQTRVHTN